MSMLESLSRLVAVCCTILLLTACDAAPLASLPSSGNGGVEVTGVTDQETATEEVVQRVAFNQCQSGSPFKAKIQFSQSSGQEQQDRLILSLGAGGEIGLPETARVTLQTAVEQHLATTRRDTFGNEEGVEIEVPAWTQQEYTILWRVTKRSGRVQYRSRGVARTVDYTYRIGVQLAAATGRDLPCSGGGVLVTTAVPTKGAASPTAAARTPVPTLTPSPIPPTPAPTTDPRLFWDDFSSLPKADWGMEGTGWAVVKDKFVADNASVAGYVGNQTWQDYAVVLRGLSIELSSTNFPSRYLEVPVRMTDRSNYIALRAYIAWAGSSSSGFNWVKVVNGTEQEIPGAGGAFKAYDSTAMLRIEVRGDKFTTIVNGTELTSFFDKTFQKGGCGLRLVSFPMSLDAYEVVRLSP